MTINGIGTTYYGKKNPTQRRAICTSCGREATLLSYDTRHWFVIIYIPIIPLGKKHIIDECSLCNRHQVIALDQWKAVSKEAVTDAIRTYQSSPSVQSAIQSHGALATFGEMAAADLVREEASEAFPEIADMRFAFGAQLEAFGRVDVARKEFEAAVEIDPDHQYACGALANYWIGDGKLSEAEKLVSFAMQPGIKAHPQLQTVDLLMQAYQKQGDHESALRCGQQLLNEVPAMATYDEFRSRVHRRSWRRSKHNCLFMATTPNGWSRFGGVLKTPSIKPRLKIPSRKVYLVQASSCHGTGLI